MCRAAALFLRSDLTREQYHRAEDVLTAVTYTCLLALVAGIARASMEAKERKSHSLSRRRESFSQVPKEELPASLIREGTE